MEQEKNGNINNGQEIGTKQVNKQPATRGKMPCDNHGVPGCQQKGCEIWLEQPAA